MKPNHVMLTVIPDDPEVSTPAKVPKQLSLLLIRG